MAKTTKVTDKEHAERQGCSCPACGSENVSANEWDGEGACQEVECEDCGATWNDVYKMVGFDNLKDANGNEIKRK